MDSGPTDLDVPPEWDAFIRQVVRDEIARLRAAEEAERGPATFSGDPSRLYGKPRTEHVIKAPRIVLDAPEIITTSPVRYEPPQTA